MILLSRRCCYCVFVFAFLLGSFLRYTRERSNGNRKIDAKKTRSEGSSGEKDERKQKVVRANVEGEAQTVTARKRQKDVENGRRLVVVFPRLFSAPFLTSKLEHLFV
jgi:hypothetical protein